MLINANIREMQSGASSLAKLEDDFPVVYGFVKDPIVSPGIYENQECYELVPIARAHTLVTTSTRHHDSIGFVTFAHMDLF